MSEEKKLSAKVEDILSKIEDLSVLELNDLVKALEEKFDVSASMPVAVQAGPAQGGAEEKSDYTVVLTSAGEGKIQVIKAVKELLGLGLKEAKDLVDGAPANIKENVPTEEAESIKKTLEEAGATVELK
ncbi:MAG: 50S ribosomal protein L7/L12 [Candidatus Pacebacteria bacterium]|nr:50S ribosomal protein L7/L12 [Candidatus Paceibacterota bacterium]